MAFLRLGLAGECLFGRQLGLAGYHAARRAYPSVPRRVRVLVSEGRVALAADLHPRLADILAGASSPRLERVHGLHAVPGHVAEDGEAEEERHDGRAGHEHFPRGHQSLPVQPQGVERDERREGEDDRRPVGAQRAEVLEVAVFHPREVIVDMLLTLSVELQNLALDRGRHGCRWTSRTSRCAPRGLFSRSAAPIHPKSTRPALYAGASLSAIPSPGRTSLAPRTRSPIPTKQAERRERDSPATPLPLAMTHSV